MPNGTHIQSVIKTKRKLSLDKGIFEWDDYVYIRGLNRDYGSILESSPAFRPCVSHAPAASVLSSTPANSHRPARSDSEVIQQRLSWRMNPNPRYVYVISNPVLAALEALNIDT